MTAKLCASVYLLRFTLLMQLCELPGVYTGPVVILEGDSFVGKWGNVADAPWLDSAALYRQQLMTSQEKLNSRYQILQDTELPAQGIVEEEVEGLELAPLEASSDVVVTETEMSKVERPKPSTDSVVSWQDNAVWWTDWQLPVFVVLFTVVGVLAITFVVLLWLKNQMVSSSKQQHSMSPSSEPGLCSPVGSSASCRSAVGLSPAGPRSPVGSGIFSFSTAEQPTQWIIHPVMKQPLEPLDPAGVQPQATSLLPEVMMMRREEETTCRREPVRIRAKGLLERRGSSASLTIELVTASHEVPCCVVTPTKECSSEEYLLSAGNVLSRSELRQCFRDTRSLHREFWDLPSNHPEGITVAGCGTKNRYRTILPNERSRVRLSRREMEGEEAEYINANYVRGYDGEERAYIATQGPLPHTIADFWTLVWQEQVPVIVMITKLFEQGRPKCEQYFPSDIGTASTYGEVDVTLDEVLPRDNCVLRHLTIQRGDECRRLSHFWYDSWPDHKTPAGARELVALAGEVEELRQRGAENQTSPELQPTSPELHDLPPTSPKLCELHPSRTSPQLSPTSPDVSELPTTSPDLHEPQPTSPILSELPPTSPNLSELPPASPNLHLMTSELSELHLTSPERTRGPVLVHCSAGIGRTGCFIAVSVGMRQLLEEDNVDILGIVCQMRYDRGGMIQTAEQYEFVHRALCLFEQSLPASE